MLGTKQDGRAKTKELEMITATFLPATQKQMDYISVLKAQRNWLGRITDATAEILDMISRRYPITRDQAHIVISQLQGCRPRPTQKPADLLSKLPVSRYALPKRDGTGWTFFELCTSTTPYLVQLIGSPSGWSRRPLSHHLQMCAAQHIAEDPKAAAVAYAREHGRCAVCNASLSDPESIARGLGPVCAKRF
jgi:hypothetical protein